MTQIEFRQAELDDATRLNAALRRLSETMGDSHLASGTDLARAAFGPVPAFYAVLAEVDGALVGVAVYSPFYSTIRAAAGAYVSDLWVDDTMRGQGLGPRLLAAVRDRAKVQWDAGFLRLAVYEDNPRAVAFYTRLGFAPMPGDIYMTLEGKALGAVGAQQ
ncbi:GNAT family N-acetyltransferase [Thalassovita taeanensis]|uniref:Acetyltransferase (GNAT) family protein n=1 Tax=Thalassovita taeanensis TaxID=657014 RepID=A0A1H9IJW7_9RHOB|nr:GNAT family N-acetyltransferase [Thalassovita taeanensis]SEQ75021.1 Acetyltransferase (GNAT) family protein [Thalassovita taeanensis]